jgi:hypothetical protein
MVAQHLSHSMTYWRMHVYSINDMFGAIILTVIIVTLTIGLLWSLSTVERLGRQLDKEKQND